MGSVGNRPFLGPVIHVRVRERSVDRVGEHAGCEEIGNPDVEVALVVEPPVSAAQDRTRLIVEGIGQSHARLHVVLVNRMFLAAREERVVFLRDRDGFDVVAQARGSR